MGKKACMKKEKSRKIEDLARNAICSILYFVGFTHLKYVSQPLLKVYNFYRTIALQTKILWVIYCNRWIPFAIKL